VPVLESCVSGMDGPESVTTMQDLARLLRWLRRRDARRRGTPELTYREIAARTGWSHGAVGKYLTGTALAPVDRFDELVRLLGATATEQGALATARDRVEDTRTSGAGRRGAPRELPADVTGFVGRAGHLSAFDAAVAAAVGTGTMPVLALSGPAGAGKTALALHWAHRRTDRYPDGQLYVDLHGTDPGRAPVDPADAVAGLLGSLGVPFRDLPAGPDARAARYRSLLSRRRVLVLLDDAASADQVQPLLPAGPDSLVLVTSREPMLELVAASGAEPFGVGPLGFQEAHELLARRLGPARLAADAEAVHDIIRRSAGSPAALAAGAARLRCR
jgi:hypothetical protein